MENQTPSSEEKVTTRSVGMRYGIIMAGIGIVVFLIIAIAGLKPDGPTRWVSVAFTFVVLYLAHQYFKKNGDGYMTIGQGVGIGFWAGLVSSVISSIFTYVYVKFVDSAFIEAMKDSQMTAMQEKGMSEEQIEQAMKIAGMFMTPEAMLGFGLVFGLIGSVVIALIVSFVTQKKNPEATFS